MVPVFSRRTLKPCSKTMNCRVLAAVVALRRLDGAGDWLGRPGGCGGNSSARVLGHLRRPWRAIVLPGCHRWHR